MKTFYPIKIPNRNPDNYHSNISELRIYKRKILRKNKKKEEKTQPTKK